MKRVIVICEGQTEQEFCNTILNPYFSAMGVFLNAPIIKHSHGGIVPWQQLSKQTSPSHRLERIIRGYDKVVYGNYLAENIGLNRICERCPRFNA